MFFCQKERIQTKIFTRRTQKNFGGFGEARLCVKRKQPFRTFLVPVFCGHRKSRSGQRVNRGVRQLKCGACSRTGPAFCIGRSNAAFSVHAGSPAMLQGAQRCQQADGQRQQQRQHDPRVLYKPGQQIANK